jgi:putative oxidoreductase
LTPQQSLENAISKYGPLGGRILISLLFLLSGVGKIGNYAGTAAYMHAMGVPTALLPLVILTEVGGALAIIVGWKTRVVAFLLAGFTLISAVVFHHNFADQMQLINFWKNVSITGAFLLLVVHGAGPLSLDNRSKK